MLVGCGVIATPILTPGQASDLLVARGADPPVVPYELSPEMREWVESRVRSVGSDLDKLHRLIEVLLNELEITYEREYTGTAREVFTSRRANCLSFTHLFVGMARELEVPVFFLEVRDLEDYQREGDLIVHSDHIAVGYGPEHDLRVIDFAARDNTAYRRMRGVDDATAIAMFYSNKGAEHLRRGDLEEARRWLFAAVGIQENLPASWINYGVVLRRLGELDAAESAYRRAIEIDPSETAAYQNLSALLRIRGRFDEADELLEVTAHDGNRNPFSFVVLGDLSRRYGRVEEAERYFRRAIRLSGGDAEAYAALGSLLLERGDPVGAQRMLRRAQRLAPDEPRVAQLARLLADRHPKRP